jgi:hypothetical protein
LSFVHFNPLKQKKEIKRKQKKYLIEKEKFFINDNKYYYKEY